MKQPKIFNIQKFSTHDGPGIRTTIFFKGCPLRCLWCHNPESQSFACEKMTNEKGEVSTVGQEYSIDELVEIVKKDQLYYDNSGGGVTLSGGEVMSQDIDYIEELITEMKKWGIEVAIDTSGFTDVENIKKILPYVDLWLYDFKMIDESDHKKYIGVSNKKILDNLKFLSDNQANINLRLFIVGDINDSLSYVESVDKYLDDNNIRVNEIDIIPYHNFGRNKYSQLDRKCTQNFEEPSQRVLNTLKSYLENNKHVVTIGG